MKPTTAEDHVCVDCRKAFDTPYAAKTVRKAPYLSASGSRCSPHNIAEKKRQKAKSNQTRLKRVEKVYGVGPEMYKRLGDYQGWKCWSCNVADGTRKALAVHHDHRTGEALALLCGPCNQFQDRVLKGSRAAALRLADVCTGPDKDLSNAPSRLAWARVQTDAGDWVYENEIPAIRRIPRQREVSDVAL